jgi:hypothetical protein
MLVWLDSRGCLHLQDPLIFTHCWDLVHRMDHASYASRLWCRALCNYVCPRAWHIWHNRTTLPQQVYISQINDQHEMSMQGAPLLELYHIDIRLHNSLDMILCQHLFHRLHFSPKHLGHASFSLETACQCTNNLASICLNNVSIDAQSEHQCHVELWSSPNYQRHFEFRFSVLFLRFLICVKSNELTFSEDWNPFFRFALFRALLEMLLLSPFPLPGHV